MNVGSSLRSFVKRSKWALIAYTALRSSFVQFKFSMGRIDSFAGSTHLRVSPAESVAYINRQFDDYFRYGKLSLEELGGKRVLEGGPGDNLGLALRFLVCGAKQVVTIDKFYARRDSEQQRRIYLALREQFNEEQRRIYDRAIDLSSGTVFNEVMLKPIYGKGMEECGDVLEEGSFDFIISRAVIQEIFDTDRMFIGMDKVLRRGGKMLHKIDLRDCGTFSGNGHHPLTFLTVPDPVYVLMSRNAGRPGRKTFGYYRKKVLEFGYQADLYVTAVVNWGYPKPPIEVIPHKTELVPGVDYDDKNLELVRSIRPHLAKRFRHLSDEDLMATGLFLIACKPA